jgi:molybdenum cofactor sulfurtransferase
MVSVAAPNSFLVNNHERFEDGTLNYLDIPAIKNGLEYIESIGIDRINNRIKHLNNWFN